MKHFCRFWKIKEDFAWIISVAALALRNCSVETIRCVNSFAIYWKNGSLFQCFSSGITCSEIQMDESKVACVCTGTPPRHSHSTLPSLTWKDVNVYDVMLSGFRAHDDVNAVQRHVDLVVELPCERPHDALVDGDRSSVSFVQLRQRNEYRRTDQTLRGWLPKQAAREVSSDASLRNNEIDVFSSFQNCIVVTASVCRWLARSHTPTGFT